MLPYKYLANFAVKQGIQKTALDALDSGRIDAANPREDYIIEKYNDPYSPLYKNNELIKEYYNPNLPIDKEPQDWNPTDLINATNSPLYKYDQQLQNNAYEYIKYRAKHRFGGLF